MSEINKEKKYFQEIAKRFNFWTGKGHFLSPRDIDLINQWKKMNIPLNIVLEGINRAFEDSRLKPNKRKTKSLRFCHFQVLRAYQQYLERKVGLPEKKEKGDKRINNALMEVKDFLNNLPDELNFLMPFYKKALTLIPKGKEDELELLDEKVESMLYEKFANNKKKSSFEGNNLYRKKLIKKLRTRYKIPYLSLFYY